MTLGLKCPLSGLLRSDAKNYRVHGVPSGRALIPCTQKLGSLSRI
jgi:hypothetical protein